MVKTIERIISGGQTGADRGALDAAIDFGLPCGGWVPLGRLDEFGRIPDCYAELREAPSAEPSARTNLNVRDADATLILSHGPLTGGSALTLELADAKDKPVLHVDLDAMTVESAIDRIGAWLADKHIATLNVAGPRASEDERIYAATLEVIAGVLKG